MTIRVDIVNKDDEVLYVEDQGRVFALNPGEGGTFYVRKDNRILIREDLRARDRYMPDRPARDRRVSNRRFEDDHKK